MTLSNEGLINAIVDAVAAAVLRKFELAELVGGLASLRDDLAALRADVDNLADLPSGLYNLERKVDDLAALRADVDNLADLRGDVENLERKLDDLDSLEDLEDKITDAVHSVLSGASLSIDL